VPYPSEDQGRAQAQTGEQQYASAGGVADGEAKDGSTNDAANDARSEHIDGDDARADCADKCAGELVDDDLDGIDSNHTTFLPWPILYRIFLMSHSLICAPHSSDTTGMTLVTSFDCVEWS
jgi:hypothetical protein